MWKDILGLEHESAESFTQSAKGIASAEKTTFQPIA